MDSVYDAAKTHAEKLKAELETIQNFLNLHDHFRDHFGLTPAAASSTAPAEVETPVVDQAAATHEIHVQEPEVAAEAPAAELHPPETHALETHALETHAPEVHASEPETIESEAAEPEPVLHAEAEPEAETPETAAVDAASEDEPRVIKASEGVLIAATSEAEVDAPLGPEATLQAVAEKLAATIGAAHPSVTGYTV
jgi:hypothetical protein